MADYTIIEGDKFSILWGTIDDSINFTYGIATVSGSATAHEDYTPLAMAGFARGMIPVNFNTVDDDLIENDEDLNLELAGKWYDSEGNLLFKSSSAISV